MFLDVWTLTPWSRISVEHSEKWRPPIWRMHRLGKAISDCDYTSKNRLSIDWSFISIERIGFYYDFRKSGFFYLYLFPFIRIPQQIRIISSLAAIFLVFMVTAILVKVPMEPLPFFIITMVKIVLINCKWSSVVCI